MKPNASDDVSRARGKRAAAEARVRRALASVPGDVVWHVGRLCVQTTQVGASSAAASGALLVGAGGNGAGKLVEPRAAVELNNALEKATLELNEAEARQAWILHSPLLCFVLDQAGREVLLLETAAVCAQICLTRKGTLSRARMRSTFHAEQPLSLPAQTQAAVRRTLSLAAAVVLSDLETQLDIVATLDSIALRARHAPTVIQTSRAAPLRQRFAFLCAGS